MLADQRNGSLNHREIRLFSSALSALDYILYRMMRISAQYIPAAIIAVAGMVNNQAIAISCATPQRTLFALSPVPAPMIVALTT